MPDFLNAFVEAFRLEGAGQGPLAGKTFAAKDLFDIAGHVTGAGNPDWRECHAVAAKHASAVQRLLDAGATCVGKTHTDELSRGIFGENAHYGTPANPRAPGRVPGGSSSGSAAAVAGGAADFAIGTDTGGSVRVPAGFCGLYGIRPSHGRVPFAGVLAQAPSFDTVGWLAQDGELLARVGEILLQATVPASVKPKRLLVAEDAFAMATAEVNAALAPALDRVGRHFQMVERGRLSTLPLSDWLAQQVQLQGFEAWQTFGGWIDRTNPRFGYEVAEAFVRGSRIDAAAAAAAREFRAARRTELEPVLTAGTVIAMPTAPWPAPLAGQPRAAMWALRPPLLSLSCIAGTLGAPQVSLPLASVAGLPVGLSLLAAPGADELLLALARTQQS